MNQAKSGIVVDALSSWLVAGLGVVSGLVFAPLIHSASGEAGYGLWRTLFQVIGYYGVLELGLRAAAVRYLAIAWADEDLPAMRGVLGACFVLAGLVVAIVVPASIVFSEQIVALFGAETALARDGVAALRLLSLSFVVATFSGILSFAIHGACRIELANRVELVSFAIRIGLGVLALVEFGTLASLAAANLAAAVVAALGYGWIFGRLYRARPSLQAARAASWLRRVLGFAGKIYAVKAGDVLRMQVALVLVASLLALEIAGTFGYVLALAGFANLAVVRLCDVLYPRLAAAHADPRRLIDTTLAHGQVVSMVAFALLGGFAVMGADFIRVWIGPDVGGSVPLATIVALEASTRMAVLATVPAVFALRAADRAEVYAVFNGLEGAVAVVLMLLSLERFGLLGVVASSLGAALLFRLVLLPIYISRVFPVSPGRTLSTLVLRPALTLFGLAPLVLWMNTFPPESWVGMAGALAAAATCLFGVGVLVGIEPSARGLLIDRLLGLAGRLRATS